MNYSIELASAESAEKLCRKISADLPEYFGLPECNESYAKGVHSCVNFIVTVDSLAVGLLSLSFPYPANCNLYWMGILKNYQRQGLGRLLLQKACTYARQCQAQTMTVETLAPCEADKNYLRTYRFYETTGFHPLFNLRPQNYTWDMVYMVKSLDTPLDSLIAIEKDARQFGFDWPNEEMIIDQAISECDEIKEALTLGESKQRIEEEIGDLLHTAISLCLFAGFEPEETLQKITVKFATRMFALKEIAKEQGFTTLKDQPLSLLMTLWHAAKEKTKS
ncbi:GNAT family N-acetyltransferase [Legionella brunensis]|uniref:GNAT family acetyltransferase n=1 Tax=Legionella brunensis TaxID=29422 RepID=A0A0W0S0K2_9GAMM|nr:GNAT family N-acetyltransferase [Legionella brunensis]KTC76960.1 GNAT family acetyltransferase [Legionella brunensis]